MPARISAFSRSPGDGRAPESSARRSRTSALSALCARSCSRAAAMRSGARACAAALAAMPRASVNASALTASRTGDRVVDGVVAGGAELEPHLHLGAHRLPVQSRGPEMGGLQRFEYLGGQALRRV